MRNEKKRKKIQRNFSYVWALGLDLYIKKIILQKQNETKRYFSRNETLLFKKRNETERYFFLKPKPKTETKYIFFRN
jgi:hypothetical protein